MSIHPHGSGGEDVSWACRVVLEVVSWVMDDRVVSASPDRTRSELLAEVDELRAEVARLHDLLGLPGRTGDEHRRAWTPTLFDTTVAPPEVSQSSPPTEKLELIRSLFGARSDLYAQRWENFTTGKSGWSPAVRGGWSNKSRRAKDHLPLTDDVFASHLRGDATIGIYPLLPGDRCALLACDFDDGSWALDALAFLDECHNTGVPAVLERSRSGAGAHVWVFFDQPVPAVSARAMGMGLLRAAMAKRAELDLASYDRFFPSQDFLPEGSFGNLIALPLHGERITHGATVFLDPTTMSPWADQWAFLSSVTRMTPDAVAALADALRPVTAGPTLSLADLAAADGPKPPPRDRRPDRRDALAATGRSPTGVRRRVETPRVARQPGVLREGTDAILDLGHTPVHPLLPAKTSSGSTSPGA